MLDKFKGEVKVYTKEVGKDKKRVIFNTCVGFNKQEDGEYLNYYMLTNFAKELKKDVAKVYEKGSFDVIIEEAWISAYLDKDEHVQPVLFISKAKIITDGSKTKKAKKEKVEPIDDEELPF